MLVRWFIAENVTANDVALCRNTKPLVETAYQFFSAGLACRVEGRDLGEGLIALATKWRRITTLGALSDRIEEYEVSEMAKWTEKKVFNKVQAIEDKCETLKIIIDNLIARGMTTVNDLVSHIRSLFGDTPEGSKPKVFTLSTIHKSKGREWDRVYIIRRDLLPSTYAKLPWQQEQERNLEYVAITRAKKELIYVD
jgi:DNA helicase-2/ATP-dependent DNA helicase PcrA